MKSNRKFLLIVMIPIFLHMTIFLLLPILGGGVISFMDYNPMRAQNTFIGGANYTQLVNDPLFWTALRNTLVFTLFTALLDVCIPLALAALISQLKSNKTRSFFRMVFFLPCIAPLVASSVVFSRSIYPLKSGLLNMMIKAMGGTPLNWTGDSRYLMLSVILFTLWADLGYNTILFTAGMDGIPADLYEAARLDGAGRWQTFRRITLPLLARTSTFVTLMTLISMLQMFAQFDVMALRGGPQYSGLVLTSYIYKTAFNNKQMGYAAAISMALFAITLVISAVQQKASKVDWEY